MRSPEILLSSLRTATESRDNLWLSVPTAHPSKEIYFPDALTDAEQRFAAALADGTSGVDHTDGMQKDHWHQYGDMQNLDFCFDAVSIQPSRFTNGDFPVWYASDSQETSQAEVTYHCQRQAELELRHTKVETKLTFQRAFYKASVRLMGFDFRPIAAANAGLMENGPPYPYCNVLGGLVYTSADGLVSLSRRRHAGELWAVMNRECVLSSVVTAYWDVDFAKDGSIVVCGNPVTFDDGWGRGF